MRENLYSNIDLENKIICGNIIDIINYLPDNFFDLIISSPPYYNQRNYNHCDQIGQEPEPWMYVDSIVSIFSKLMKKLKPTGSMWINIGDSYATKSFLYPGYGLELNQRPKMEKQMFGIPMQVCLGLQQKGCILKTDVIWDKPSAMPSSVSNRPTRSHEYLYMFTRNPSDYYFDNKHPLWREQRSTKPKGVSKYKDVELIDKKSDKQSLMGNNTYAGFNARWKLRDDLDETRNRRTVWRIDTAKSKLAHVAVYPEKLIEPIISACCPEGGIVFDPFIGSGTTARVAKKLNRNYSGCEINPDYINIIEKTL